MRAFKAPRVRQFHLQGQHDQQSHGSGGGSVVESGDPRSAQDLADAIMNGSRRGAAGPTLDKLGMDDPVQAETIRLTMAVQHILATVYGEPDLLREAVEARFLTAAPTRTFDAQEDFDRE